MTRTPPAHSGTTGIRCARVARRETGRLRTAAVARHPRVDERWEAIAGHPPRAAEVRHDLVRGSVHLEHGHRSLRPARRLAVVAAGNRSKRGHPVRQLTSSERRHPAAVRHPRQVYAGAVDALPGRDRRDQPPQEPHVVGKPPARGAVPVRAGRARIDDDEPASVGNVREAAVRRHLGPAAADAVQRAHERHRVPGRETQGDVDERCAMSSIKRHCKRAVTGRRSAHARSWARRARGARHRHPARRHDDQKHRGDAEPGSEVSQHELPTAGTDAWRRRGQRRPSRRGHADAPRRLRVRSRRRWCYARARTADG